MRVGADGKIEVDEVEYDKDGNILLFYINLNLFIYLLKRKAYIEIS